MALHVHNLYFFTKFKVDLKPAVDAFKAARLFWPQKINDLNPDSEAIDSLRAFPFLQDQVLLSNLKAKLPHYLASTVDLGSKCWSTWLVESSHWNPSSLVGNCFPGYVISTSAAAEWVFSLLTNTFSERQDASLHDYIETSLMLQFNNQ